MGPMFVTLVVDPLLSAFAASRLNGMGRSHLRRNHLLRDADHDLVVFSADDRTALVGVIAVITPFVVLIPNDVNSVTKFKVRPLNGAERLCDELAVCTNYLPQAFDLLGIASADYSFKTLLD